MKLAGLLTVAGFVCIAVGAFLWSIPLGWVVSGSALVFMARSSAEDV